MEALIKVKVVKPVMLTAQPGSVVYVTAQQAALVSEYVRQPGGGELRMANEAEPEAEPDINLDAMTTAQLTAYAAEKGIKLPAKASKPTIIAVIREAL